MEEITQIYLIRHAQALKIKSQTELAQEKSQIKNEKIILSVNGEKQAEKLSSLKELENINTICGVAIMLEQLVQQNT